MASGVERIAEWGLSLPHGVVRMARLHSVVLARALRPKFPDRCVASGKDRPGFATRVLGREAVKGVNLLDGWLAVRVPCCRDRRWGLHARRVLNAFLTLTVVALGTFWGVLTGAHWAFRQLGRGAPPIEWACAA